MYHINTTTTRTPHQLCDMGAEGTLVNQCPGDRTIWPSYRRENTVVKKRCKKIERLSSLSSTVTVI